MAAKRTNPKRKPLVLWVHVSRNGFAHKWVIPGVTSGNACAQDVPAFRREMKRRFRRLGPLEVHEVEWMDDLPSITGA